MFKLYRLSLSLLLLITLVGCGGPAAAPAGPTPPADALVVRMLYGSEKQAWIEAVTAKFNALGQRSSSGRPIVIEAVPSGSADAVERMLSGQEQPAIWSPASSLLIPLANERWASAHNGARLAEGTPEPLVLSPVVIAMWKPMAEALGWPQQPLGWSEIAELASNGKSWADYGHPEWGRFQFGHTHPDYSNSGIASILAVAYAGAGKTRGLTAGDIAQPEIARFMAGVEQGVIHYGESTGFFGRQMFSRGPGYLSAAVLYENLVVESYDKELYPSRALPVVAIYPREGTFWSDHPFVIPNAPWVSDELRAAATSYRDFLLARPQQELALQFGFRPADTGVPLNMLTAELGVDLKEPRTLLEVPEADAIAAVREAWSQNKKRVEVQVVLDVSGSMEEEGRMEQAKAALQRFVERLDDRDALGITVFSTTATELTPLGELGPKRAEITSRVGGLFPDGGTRLVDTVREAYERMQQQPPGERIRALVVLSDGADNESSGSPSDLLQLLRQDERGTSIKVFTIAYGTGSDVDTELMSAIAEVSGARSYVSGPDAIVQIYNEIATFF